MKAYKSLSGGVLGNLKLIYAIDIVTSTSQDIHACGELHTKFI